ncbi:TPA: hypothetical protein N0F65_004144 [Lagenidium giganteum]|uniref:5-methyltetrahydropteroyltriglutamate--homocysteine S-methyltransferase n=1 Tax=Lagenidium giganteum TaxID=4803 RepID=A0AAV2ZAC5_9STRA|nr:TPA: hypothetical protein N0F65_004144 [Lagenidium giganteum]
MTSLFRSLLHTREAAASAAAPPSTAAVAQTLLNSIQRALVDAFDRQQHEHGHGSGKDATGERATPFRALTLEEIEPIKQLCDQLQAAHFDTKNLMDLNETVKLPVHDLEPASAAKRKGHRSRSCVRYQHIWEDERVSIGIFILPPGASIPLHDHPDMSVISRVLHGSLHVQSCDLLGPTEMAEALAENTSIECDASRQQLARVVTDRVMHGPFTTELLPDHGNIHQFIADSEVGCAIFDILTPPYDPAEGRDCTYYRIVGDHTCTRTTTAAAAASNNDTANSSSSDSSTAINPTPRRLWTLEEYDPEHFEMARVWLRMELFEQGLLQFPSKYAATLTLANVKNSLDVLHQRFQEHAASDMDTTTSPTANADQTMQDVGGGFVESDNYNTISFPFWKEAVASVFPWREQDFKAFWLLLVYFHRKHPCSDALPAVVLDEEHCLLREEVPVFKIAIFLFIQTVKPHSWRSKHAMETFNAVWHRENTAGATSEPGTPVGSMSPQLKGSSSPPPPSSPHMMGMQDRSTSDAYYLSFVREKLDDLFSLLFPSLEMTEKSNTVVSAEQVDLLGFLFGGGDKKLSACYPHWTQPSPGGQAASLRGTENGAKISRFFKKHMYLNESLYPPVGFSLGGSGMASGMHSFPVVSDLSLADDRIDEPNDDDAVQEDWQKPVVLQGISKTTVIKRPEEFTDDTGKSDLVIFSCNDACIYILGPLSAIAGLLRVSNCLDSVVNAYTLVPLIMTGENVNVELGPFNTKYSGLAQQMVSAKFAYKADFTGAWNSFLNLECDEDNREGQKEPITLQSPTSFREICVPIKPTSTVPAERPFPIPVEYVNSLKQQHETVEKLRKLVCSDEFDMSTKRTIEMVLQYRFKEWLTMTGNVRQILDLVHLERARSGSMGGSTSAGSTVAGSASSQSPAKDNTPVDSGTLGFPRMGPNRELKFSLEKFWRNKCTEEELYAVAHAVERQNWQEQLKRGVNRVAVGMFSLYDHVLDWTFYLGLAPERFQSLPAGTLAQYFAMARGVDGIPALDMTKWFDTNYHYEVPELNERSTPRATFSKYLDAVKRALEVVGPNKTAPVVLGPLTYLALSKIDSSTTFEALLGKILPLYKQLLVDLAALGIREVQVHEPSLVGVKATKLVSFLPQVYGLNDTTGVLEHPEIALNLVTYFEEIDHSVYEWFKSSRVAAISLDFTRGDNVAVLQKFGFPAGKRLGAGLIDGRGIWKWTPDQLLAKLEAIQHVLSSTENASLTIQTSCSLQHVPYTTECEAALEAGETEGLLGVLSFAYQKLDELEVVKKIALNGQDAVQDQIHQAKKAWEQFYLKNPAKATVQDRIKAVKDADFERPAPFDERRPHQLRNLPLLPTTTIGSFPQTAQIRALRRKLKGGEISLQAYQAKIDEQIAFNMGIQEALGLDILVHGEPERTDMVEYFAEKLHGFAFTQNGWVQSYGSRCVRPPIIFADLERPEAMTVREFVVAQSFTTKPVKGMLTGPVTILNWSFPRQDISRKLQAFQLALCLRDEVADLEAAKCTVVQVDEPALREGMPLKALKKDEYLEWAVQAFKLSTAVAKVETSIHTHMCYCEFEDCMHAIDAIDADVNSIENARSDDATIRSFKEIGYKRDLGPGTYDIHSPVVPPKEDIVKKLQSFLNLLPANTVVVNPDCGLKTRKWPETIAALRNMVDATREVRATLKK